MNSWTHMLILSTALVSMLSCERGQKNVETSGCDPSKGKCTGDSNSLSKPTGGDDGGFTSGGDYDSTSSGWSSTSDGTDWNSTTTSGYYPTTTSGYYPTSGGYQPDYYPTTTSGYYPTSGGYQPDYYPTTTSGYYPTSSGYQPDYYPTTTSGYYPTSSGYQPDYYPTTTGGGFQPNWNQTTGGFTNDPTNVTPMQLGITAALQITGFPVLTLDIPIQTRQQMSQVSYRVVEQPFANTNPGSLPVQPALQSGFTDLGVVELWFEIRFVYSGRQCRTASPNRVTVGSTAMNAPLVPLNIVCSY